jgi:hypothetical protein
MDLGLYITGKRIVLNSQNSGTKAGTFYFSEKTEIEKECK